MKAIPNLTGIIAKPLVQNSPASLKESSIRLVCPWVRWRDVSFSKGNIRSHVEVPTGSQAAANGNQILMGKGALTGS